MTSGSRLKNANPVVVTLQHRSSYMTKTDITTSLVLGGQFTIDHNIVIRHYQAELRCYIMKLAWERHERFNLGVHCLQRLHRHEVPAKNVLEELFTVGPEVIDAREPPVRYAVTFVTDNIKDNPATAKTGSSMTQVLSRRYTFGRCPSRIEDLRTLSGVDRQTHEHGFPPKDRGCSWVHDEPTLLQMN